MRCCASPVPIRMTGERHSPWPTFGPENVSPNTDTSFPLGANIDAPRSVLVTPHRSVMPGPVMSASFPSVAMEPARIHRYSVERLTLLSAATSLTDSPDRNLSSSCSRSSSGYGRSAMAVAYCGCGGGLGSAPRFPRRNGAIGRLRDDELGPLPCSGVGAAFGAVLHDRQCFRGSEQCFALDVRLVSHPVDVAQDAEVVIDREVVVPVDRAAGDPLRQQPVNLGQQRPIVVGEHFRPLSGDFDGPHGILLLLFRLGASVDAPRRQP